MPRESRWGGSRLEGDAVSLLSVNGGVSRKIRVRVTLFFPVVALIAVVFSIVASSRVEAAPTRRGDRVFLAELVAQSFFRGLLDGRLKAIMPLCAKRVRFEGRWVERAALRHELSILISRAHRHALKLRALVILDLAEMIRRFGPPPKRLRIALRRGDLIALARFNHLGVVAALRREGDFYRIHLLTD